MTMTPEELRAAIEAILFVSGEPVILEELSQAFPDQSKETIEQQITEIENSFAQREGGFILERAAGGLRFSTRPDLDPHLRKYFARKNEGRLSLAALETMAIVAYRQPITVPEINDIRGVNSSGVIRTLLDRKMIKISGRKSVVGSPFLYRTTREFLLHFGLESIQDLPKLEEFSEILGESLADELLTSMSEEDILETPADQQGARTSVTEPSGDFESADGDAEAGNEARDDAEGSPIDAVSIIDDQRPAPDEDDLTGEEIDDGEESFGSESDERTPRAGADSSETASDASTTDEDALESDADEK